MVKIFIGNLACNTTAEELRELFEKYGKITECDVVKNYGFVHMSSVSEAEEAIRNLNQHQLHGWRMNVEMSKGRPKSTTKLHVGNLGEGVTNDDLRAKFEAFGTVVECDIVKDYAFVHMERVEDAMDAIVKLDNTAFKGKLMNVQLSTSRLRTAPGMGDHTGGRSSYGLPRGPPGYGRGGPPLPPPPPPPPPRRVSGYSSEYTSRGSFLDRPSAPYSSADYYEKFRAPSFGSSYFEDRRMSYIAPPPPPSSSSLSKHSALDPYDHRPPPSTAATAYYAQAGSPIRRVPASTTGYPYEQTRLSPVSSSRSSYSISRTKDHYSARYAPY
uniref:RNA-binding protein 14 n=1 Tax=Sphaeramia orbicularis TaxID=375764 RepID=A0A673ADT3_9TELE